MSWESMEEGEQLTAHGPQGWEEEEECAMAKQ